MQPLELIVIGTLITSLVFVEDIDLFRMRVARPIFYAVLLATAVLLAPTRPDVSLLCSMLALQIAATSPNRSV
jgi:hypothetical protein